MVDPRLPFATRTAFVRGPEGHLTKTLGNLWARTLFFLLIISSFRYAFIHLSNFGVYPTSHLPGLQIWLLAKALLSWFLQGTCLPRKRTELLCRYDMYLPYSYCFTIFTGEKILRVSRSNISIADFYLSNAPFHGRINY